MTEIIICRGCKGSGTVEVSELEDYHHGPYNIECEICKGSGRLIKTKTVKIEPFPFKL